MEQYNFFSRSLTARLRKHSRMMIVSLGFALLLAIGLNQTANARLGQAITPLNSPTRPPIVVKANCGRNINPSCLPVAYSNIGARITSHFYIDGVERGRANKLYRSVCSKYHLSKGYHGARVRATDSRGNVADTGTLPQAIKCR